MRATMLTGLLLLGCAHDDRMTAAEHRNEAAIHQSRAASERSQVDADEFPQRGAMINQPLAFANFSPTTDHQQQADRELRLAAEDRAAAKRLEAFEDEACRGLPAAERSACPLLGSSVILVQATKEGFALTLKPFVDVADTYRRLSCHLAFARAMGFDQPTCPLFVKGTTLRRVGDHDLAFDGDSPDVRTALRRQASKIFAGPALSL
jgi:hypothetical protein